MVSDLINRVSSYIGIKCETVCELASKAPQTYRRYSIAKANGNGVRTIFHPSKETKNLQYALINVFLSKLKIHRNATAYVKTKGSPIQINAVKHAIFRYSVRIDFCNFFPSITPQLLFKSLASTNNIVLTGNDESFLEHALFVYTAKNTLGLAIGAPSSPIVSNIVMYDLDESFSSFANSTLDGVYSRYADDIVFSCNQKGTCANFVNHVQSILEKRNSKLKLNQKKTIYMSRGTKRVITGMTVSHTGKVSIGRGKKRHIKALIHRFMLRQLDMDQQNYLKGYLAYIRDVEPQFINVLSHKYGSIVMEQISKL